MRSNEIGKINFYNVSISNEKYIFLIRKVTKITLFEHQFERVCLCVHVKIIENVLNIYTSCLYSFITCSNCSKNRL